MIKKLLVSKFYFWQCEVNIVHLDSKEYLLLFARPNEGDETIGLGLDLKAVIFSYSPVQHLQFLFGSHE